MGRYRGPGPGRVAQFAHEVKDDWRDESQWAKGVRSAVAWVMGEEEKHPITRQRKSDPPDMQTIAKAATLAANDTVNDPQLSAEYYAGVKDCLDWITGDSGTRPQEFSR